MGTAYAGRRTWTDADFNGLTWHDNRIHAMMFGAREYELAFDIDHILEWRGPQEEEGHYRFLVAPATLVFKHVRELRMDVYAIEVFIDDISREVYFSPGTEDGPAKLTEYEWTIRTPDGDIRFHATGFELKLRQDPVESVGQDLSLWERGGVFL